MNTQKVLLNIPEKDTMHSLLTCKYFSSVFDIDVNAKFFSDPT